MLRALLIVAVLCAPAVAEDDDTLRFYLSKSSLVVSGEIVDGPTAHVSELGVVNYGLTLKVAKVLKGKADDGELRVRLSLFGLGRADEMPAHLKKGAKVILFLKREWNRPEHRSWQQADGWFAAQQFNSVLEQSLVRVLKEE